MIKPGNQVRVLRISDFLAARSVAQKLGEVGKVEAIRIVDGSGLGYEVSFKDGIRGWFFADELEPVS